MTCATASYVYVPKHVDDWLVLASINFHHPSSFKCFFVQGHFMLSRDSSTRVRDLACSGSGVWVSFSRRATVQLFHSVTKTLLQEIDIEKAFSRIVLSKSCTLNMMLCIYMLSTGVVGVVVACCVLHHFIECNWEELF